MLRVGYWADGAMIIENNNGVTTKGNPTGEPIKVLEGDEARAYLWTQAWEQTDDSEKKLMLAVYPQLEKMARHKLIQPHEIYKIVRKKVYQVEELTTECTRCGGTGHYSFNQMHGTVCFKCNGNKRMFPRQTKKWFEKVRVHFNQGE